MDYNITIPAKAIRDAWSEECSLKEWIAQYQQFSDSFNNWDIDLKLASHIITNIKKNYIDKYKNENIPEILIPLLISSINHDIKNQNLENINVSLEDVSGDHELEAIKRLRKYKFITYQDAINLFCDGYDYANINKNINLSDISIEDLLSEIKKRI